MALSLLKPEDLHRQLYTVAQYSRVGSSRGATAGRQSKSVLSGRRRRATHEPARVLARTDYVKSKSYGLQGAARRSAKLPGSQLSSSSAELARERRAEPWTKKIASDATRSHLLVMDGLGYQGAGIWIARLDSNRSRRLLMSCRC